VFIAYSIIVNYRTFLLRMWDLWLACISLQRLRCRAREALACRYH